MTINQYLMHFVTTALKVEGEMASTERIVEYTQLEQQNQHKNKKPVPEIVQDKEYLEVKNLQFRYNTKQDLILKGLNFTIKAGERIGIVGRTGAGKSSITSALFRLAEPEPCTQILVGGLDITKMDVQEARKQLAIIPQDPFLFSGTLRQNLCPFSQAAAEGIKFDGSPVPDERLWEVLEQVKMKEYFHDQPG